MQDSVSQPVALGLQIVFVAWAAFGLWVLVFYPLFKHLKGAPSQLFPKWWKVLLAVYILSISTVLIVAYNVMRNPEDLSAAIGYTGLALGGATLIIGLILGAILLLPGLVKDGAKNVKSTPRDMAMRLLHVLLVIAALYVAHLFFR